jgi:hypothetical protein
MPLFYLSISPSLYCSALHALIYHSNLFILLSYNFSLSVFKNLGAAIAVKPTIERPIDQTALRVLCTARR